MISVCLTTYNGEKYIQAQMDSILSQIGAEDEVIVSDDGSSDSTLQLLYAYEDRRIKVFHHDSSTVTTTFPLDKPTHNFEHALHQAKGDIIFLSDQDDVWLPGKVETMLKALEESDFAVHDCIVVDEELKPFIPSYFHHIGIHQGVLANAVKATYLGCCMAMRRTVVEAAFPFPKTKVGHDLWLGMVADMKFRTTLVHTPLVYYRKHNRSMTPSGTRSQYGLWFKIDYRLTILWEAFRKACSTILTLLMCLPLLTACDSADEHNGAWIPSHVLERYACECQGVLSEAIAASQHSPNRNKSIGVFGGSIASLYDSNYAKSYWMKYLSATVTDYGVYGQGFVTSGGNIMQQVDKAQMHDIYILWCSTNDWTGSYPAGEPSDYTEADGQDSAKLRTQCGGMNYCITKLQALNPHAEIYVFGSLKWFQNSSGYDENSPIPNGTGKNFHYYVQKQQEVAALRGVHYLSQWDIPEVNPQTAPLFFKPDSVHLTPMAYVNIGPYQLYSLATGTNYQPNETAP